MNHDHDEDEDRMSNERVHLDGLRPSDVSLLQRVAEEAAERAVNKTFTAMGLDPTTPIKAQADMVWLRSTRERCEGAEGKALVTLVGLLVLGVASTFWSGLKAMFHP